MAARVFGGKQFPEARIMSFGQMLDGAAAYVMPAVQRPFQWEESEVSQLVHDLASALAAAYPFYFVGHIVVVRRPDGALEVVDGQQRLATVSIVIAYVRDRVQTSNPALADAMQERLLTPQGLMRVSLRPKDARFFQSKVLTPGAALAMARTNPKKGEVGVPCETDSQELIWAAARTVHHHFERTANDALAAFARFLLDEAVVSFIEVADRSSAAILFRGMNSTGRDLSAADLMKLVTIEESGLSGAQLDDVIRNWEDTEDMLGRRAFADLLELMPLILTGRQLKQRSDLNEWKATVFGAVSAERFLTDVLPTLGEIKRRLLAGDPGAAIAGAPEAQGRDIEKWLKCLVLLQDREWLAPAITALYRHGDDPAFLHGFFRRLDRLAFACFLEGASADVWERRMGAVIRGIADPKALFEHAGPFDLAPEETAKVRDRLNEPFKRESWRRRAVAFRADAAMGGTAYLSAPSLTLEHVAPAKHSKKWQADGWSSADHAKFAHLLGNFALITEPQNQAASGKLYFEKRAVYFEGKDVVVHKLTDDLRKYPEWKPEMVRGRTETLASALMTEWNLITKLTR